MILKNCLIKNIKKSLFLEYKLQSLVRVFFRCFACKNRLRIFICKIPKNGYLIRLLLTILDNIELTVVKIRKIIDKTYKKSCLFLAVCYNVVGRIYKGEILTVWVIGLPSSPNSYNHK